MISELKAFLLRGDVVTLAVAVIIGAAFGSIVTSLVEDVITPLLGILFSVPDFSKLALGGTPDPADPTKMVGGIMIGKFINSIINFIMVGSTLFFVVKAAGKNAEEVK